MITIRRPAEHVKKLLGLEPVLIYGDLDGSELVLYSNSNLSGYAPEGDVYSKRMPFVDDAKTESMVSGAYTEYQSKTVLILNEGTGKYERRKVVVDEPHETTMDFFGVSSTFGYVSSDLLRRFYFPGTGIILPSDIKLSHEGAHVASLKHWADLGERYFDIISWKLKRATPGTRMTMEELMLSSLSDAVAMFTETAYMDKYEPEWKDWFIRKRGNDWYPSDIEAFRLVREHPDRIEDLVSEIRELNTNRIVTA